MVSKFIRLEYARMRRHEIFVSVFFSTALILCQNAMAQDQVPSTALSDDEQVEAVHKGTKIITAADGVPIAYTSNGNTGKPGIVFVHSILASSMNWERQLESDLSENYHLAALDMRGHGASGKPWSSDYYLEPSRWAGDISAVVSDAKMEKPVLVAWSYGGLFAMDYIRTYGADSLSGLVLVGSKAGLEEPAQPAPPTLTRRIQVAQNTSQNISVIYDWTKGYMNFLIEDGPDAEAEKARFLAASLMAPHYIRPYFRQRPTDNRDLLPQLNMPMSFIVGSKDVVNKPDDVQAIAGQIGGVPVNVYEDTGSMPFWYQADRFNADLKSFLDGLPR